MFNVAVGIVWQLSLVALPIYIVLRNWPVAGGIFAVLLVTSTIMKFNWYDKLEKDEPAQGVNKSPVAVAGYRLQVVTARHLQLSTCNLQLDIPESCVTDTLTTKTANT